jgi:hypothetical protein
MNSLNLSQGFEANRSIADFSSALKSGLAALGLENVGSVQSNSTKHSINIPEIVLEVAQQSVLDDTIPSIVNNRIPISSTSSSDKSRSYKTKDTSEDILGKTPKTVNSDAAEWNPTSSKNLLSKSTSIAIESLVKFRDDPNFFRDSKTAFGEEISFKELKQAIEKIMSGKAEIDVKVVNSDTRLNSGAFAAETNTIYFSEDFLKQNKTNPENIANVLLEEWGHYLDNILNDTDSDGDEGEIFVSLVKGFNFDLGTLKAENDHASLEINGSNVTVEQAAFGTISLPTSWVVFRSDRGSILAFKRDATVSALTDVYFFINGVERQVENLRAPINIFNGQFRIVTRINNTSTGINPDGTIGFRPGFIQPRLTVNAPRWTRIR